MSQPVWQPNYVDLCEESTVRFGAECVICGARYATPVETIAREFVASAMPGSPLAHEIADLKYQRFTEFDGAFRELSITCYRCGRVACPDCWDDDNRMCAECVLSRGLKRSPRVGPPGRGPLQDGRLERSAAGRYSDTGQPTWLNHLLETEAARAGYTPPAIPPVARHESSLEVPGAASSAAALVLPMPFELSDPRPPFSEETMRLPTPAPPIGRGSVPPPWSISQGQLSGDARFETSEGNATSNMVTCPRCGTANYDFVTRCTVCQLQLIQICSTCQKLNAGYIKQCEFCGAPLDRPQGWSGVQPSIKPVPPKEVPQVPRARVTAPFAPTVPSPPSRSSMPPLPAQTMPEPRPPARKSGPRMVPTGAPALDSAAFAMPGAPAPSAFEALPPAPHHARRSWSVADILITNTDRLASLVLFLIILVLIGSIVAAEVSPQADAFIASLIHIDLRVMIANFQQQLRHLAHQDS